MPGIDVLPMWPLLAASLAFLVPVGISLLVAGALAPRLARQVALAPLGALVLATLGYALSGFALHFGGIGLIIDHPDLQGLVWEWSALSADWAATWGMAGLSGFALQDVQTPVAMLLFLSILPWATTATLIPLLALRGRAPRLVTAVVGLLVAAVGYPLLGNWVQGGGWLAMLGRNIGAGDGFRDAGGASVFLLGASVTLAAMLLFVPRGEDESAGELPPVHLPLLAVLGAWLVLAGSTGWLLASPLNDWTKLSAVQAVVLLLLGAAAGGAAPLFYTWFVANQPDALQGARGIVAGWVIALALGPQATPLAVISLGFAGGLLLIFGTYAVGHWLKQRDPGGLLVTLGLPAIIGLLANGISPLAPTPTGQWQAQALGTAAIFLLGFLATVIITGPLVLVWRAWQRNDAAEQPPANAAAPD